MMPALSEQLLDWDHAFDDRFVTTWTVCVGVILLAAPLAIYLLGRSGRLGSERRTEALRRWRLWAGLVVMLLAPALLGAGPIIIAVGVLSLLCYREFARATGLFREKVISIVVVLSIVAITLAVLDRWYGLFIALTPLSIGVLGTTALLSDRPKGYVQRVALGVVAVVLFGMCLAHIGYCANRAPYRPLILWLFASSLAYPLIARAMRRLPGPVLLPNTTPGRTVLGDGIATLLTAGLSALLGFFAFRDTALEKPGPLITMGLIVAVAGWLSDLMLAAVRRDLGIPEPAIGRLVDLVAGLILTAPAVFYYVNYHVNLVSDQPARILTGG
jgi:phosphatidate cytidylyltransferase